MTDPAGRRPNIVVLDGFAMNPGDMPWDPVERLGNLAVHPRTPAELIVERALAADILLTNKTPLDAATIALLPRLAFVSVLATGYDVVDVEAAARRGIPVSNVAGYATGAVAQHVLALLLEMTNRVGLHDQAVKAGDWASCRDFSFTRAPLVELAGKTLGIVGFGRIGRRVAELGAAMGMRVAVSAPRRHDPPPGVTVTWLGTEKLFAAVDVVSLHCPLTADNKGFVDRALLGRMRPGSYLVNTARGGLVNEADLAWALREGILAGAAVDVVSREPIRPDNPLLTAPNVVITPHVAWAGQDARRRLMDETARNIEAFLRGEPRNLVNSPRERP